MADAVTARSFQVNRIGAGGFFGEVALTAAEERSADVVSLGATGGMRCDAQARPPPIARPPRPKTRGDCAPARGGGGGGGGGGAGVAAGPAEGGPGGVFPADAGGL